MSPISPPSLAAVVWLVFKKELTETLRDRRTLMVMILLPLALYPLIGVGMAQFVGAQRQAQKARVAQVGVVGPAFTALDAAITREGLAQLHRPKDREHAVEALKARRVDLVVVVPSEYAMMLRDGESVEVELLYDKTVDHSTNTLERIREEIRALVADLLAARQAEAGLPPSFSRPIVVTRESIASPRDVGGFVLARVLPFLVVMMVLLGAFYPAIDLTAGEKERGTLEALLVAPVPRLALMGGKFLVVTTIATFTGLLNLGSVGLTVALAADGLGGKLQAAGGLEIPWSALAMTVVAILPTAAFFSAVMLAVASLARSFKEAQNLLTPVYLICALPAALAQLPGIELGVVTALVPGVNVALLTRGLISGQLHLGLGAVTLIATSVYALLALMVAARVFDSERLLFAAEGSKGGFMALFRRRSRDADADADADAGADAGAGAGAGAGEDDGHEVVRNSPRLPIREVDPGQAAMVLMAVMALVVLVGTPLQSRNIIGGLLVTEWVLILMPVAVLVFFARLPVADALRWRRPAHVAWAGAILAGLVGWYVVGTLVEQLQERFLPMPKEMLEAMHRALFATQRPLALDLFALAISPAICEELLFRGVVLRSSHRLPLWAQVASNAVLFGLFHLSIYRFASTAALGAVLTLIAVRSGSVLPGMLFHAINNAIAVTLGRVLGLGG
ncbi:MAG: CPBP family intramembrane metalloprotease [Deltaproteobacteria bacterium]|nr:CPBP family intramembrane metalloprotease [Deltaproteobacteria bacterium]